MRHFFSLATLLLLSTSTFAQIRTAPLSQKQIITQNVGFTEVKIEYCRPSMRERKIFGGLLPYDRIWRTGANRNSQISFSKGVTIGGKQLEAGTYTLFTKPGVDQWQVYFYPYDNAYGIPMDFDEAKARAHVTVDVVKLNRTVQDLTINLADIEASDASLTIAWEQTMVSVPLAFTTESDLLADIATLNDSHSSDYYTAARYYLETGMDLDQAEAFIQKAVELRDQPGGTPKFWIYKLQAEILLAKGELKAAKKSAQRAYEMAESRGPEDRYVRQISELLEQLK